MVRLLTALTCLIVAACVAQTTPELRRQHMVKQQIEQRGVKDPKVLEVLRATPRHLFVPEAARARAYGDHPLPIGFGQTISQPYIVAFMTELLKVEPDSRVLEIGTGSGYQAAILAQLVQQVYSIEVVEPLAEQARSLLRQQGHRNVLVRYGDGYKGWPEEAPFDRILLTAAPPEIPQVLVEQLKPGGRLVAPVGGNGRDQDLILLEKGADGTTQRRTVLAVAFVPMVHQ